MDVRVISIGALAANPYWDERRPVRTGHATTTLIRTGDRAILVDPGLPAAAVVARLGERAGIAEASDITDVFLTRIHPDTRRGIQAFADANWWLADAERERAGSAMALNLKSAAEEGDEELTRSLELEVAILQRCRPPADALAPGVDLFPLPGVSSGLTGLIIGEPTRTILVTGDAIPTVEHLAHGSVMSPAADVDQARESFAEAIEIADILVLGRDNAVMNPAMRH